MVTKKKPAGTTTKSETLDAQARNFHKLIAETEDDIAPLYWRLGEVIKEIRQALHLDWKSLMKHCKGLGLFPARVSRAIRVHTLHKNVRDVNGLSLFKALKQERKPVVAQKVGSPLTDGERRTALSFVKHLGGYDRATEVLEMVVEEVSGGKPGKVTRPAPVKPVEPPKGKQGSAKRRARHALQVVASSTPKKPR
jgi:hypothetical protein